MSWRKCYNFFSSGIKSEHQGTVLKSKVKYNLHVIFHFVKDPNLNKDDGKSAQISPQVKSNILINIFLHNHWVGVLQEQMLTPQFPKDCWIILTSTSDLRTPSIQHTTHKCNYFQSNSSPYKMPCVHLASTCPSPIFHNKLSALY